METTEYKESRLGYEIAIDEMQKLLDEQGKSITAIKRIVEQVFAASSLVVGLSSTLGLFGAEVHPDRLVVYNILTGFTILLYISLIILSVWVLQPIEFQFPVKADWDVLYDGFVNHDNDLDVLKQRLSCLLGTINLNEPIIAWRLKRARCTSMLFPAIVVLLFVLSLIKN